MNYCKDCVYYEYNVNGNMLHQCLRQEYVSRVTGEKLVQVRDCRVEREEIYVPGNSPECTADGVMFKPKPAPQS